MNILVINCGSSSLKFQLIDSETEKCIAKGLCERQKPEQTGEELEWRREGTDRNSHAGSHRSNPSCTGSTDQS